MYVPNETVIVVRSRGRRVGNRLIRSILTSRLFTMTRWHEILHQRMYATFGITSESMTYLCLLSKLDRISISGHCTAVGRVSPSKLLFVNIFQVMFDIVHVLMVFGPRSLSSISSIVESLISVCNEPILTAELVRRSSMERTVRELGVLIVKPFHFKTYHTKRERP